MGYREILEDNRRLLKLSCRDLLSGDRGNFVKVINSITRANLEVTKKMRQTNPRWNPNWLHHYLKEDDRFQGIAPNIGKCAKAAIAEKESIEKMLKEDKKLGKWEFTAIGSIANGKMLVVELPNASNYPDPFNHRGPLHRIRYGGYVAPLSGKLRRHGLPPGLVADNLACYILDAPLYAYEAILLKENNAEPI